MRAQHNKMLFRFPALRLLHLSLRLIACRVTKYNSPPQGTKAFFENSIISSEITKPVTH
jgi:hypothetical protein